MRFFLIFQTSSQRPWICEQNGRSCRLTRRLGFGLGQFHKPPGRSRRRPACRPPAELELARPQNTDILQWHPSFPAGYYGPNSLSSQAASSETVDFDVMAGLLVCGREPNCTWTAWLAGLRLEPHPGPRSLSQRHGLQSRRPARRRDFCPRFHPPNHRLGGAQQDVPDDSLHSPAVRTSPAWW